MNNTLNGLFQRPENDSCSVQVLKDNDGKPVSKATSVPVPFFSIKERFGDND